MTSAALLNEHPLLKVACAVARRGATLALRHWCRRDQLQISAKASADDLVSQADREVEQVIRERLRRLRPRDTICGEELPDSVGSSDVQWWIDPIDGTTSFLYGRVDWAVSVAAISRRDGQILAGAVAEPAVNRLTLAGLGTGTWMSGATRGRSIIPVGTELARSLIELNLGRPDQRSAAGPMLAALATEVRDIRRGGSAAAALAALATGRADAVWLPGLQPWDGAAGCILATEAGATIGDLHGDAAGRWPAAGDVLGSAPLLWPRLQALIAPAYLSPARL